MFFPLHLKHYSSPPSEEEAEPAEEEVSVPAEEGSAGEDDKEKPSKPQKGKPKSVKPSAKPQKPPQSKGQPGKANGKANVKANGKANGVAAKPADGKKLGSLKKKDNASGPKKAKIAKVDGEVVKKGDEVTKEKVNQEGGVTKSEPGVEKKDGSRFEKKSMKKKHKNPVKKNRIGKNKFKKLKKLITQEDTML